MTSAQVVEGRMNRSLRHKLWSPTLLPLSCRNNTVLFFSFVAITLLNVSLPQITFHSPTLNFEIFPLSLRRHYKIIQIVSALWLAIKPFYMSVCKHGFRSSFISYFIKETASRRGFLRLSRVLPTSRVFTSGYVNTETMIHFFNIPYTNGRTLHVASFSRRTARTGKKRKQGNEVVVLTKTLWNSSLIT